MVYGKRRALPRATTNGREKREKEAVGVSHIKKYA